MCIVHGKSRVYDSRFVEDDVGWGVWTRSSVVVCAWYLRQLFTQQYYKTWAAFFALRDSD